MFDWLRPHPLRTLSNITLFVSNLCQSVHGLQANNHNQELQRKISDMKLLFQNLKAQSKCKSEENIQPQTPQQNLQRILAIPQECQQFLTYPRAPKTKLISRYKNRGPYRSYSLQEKKYVAYLHSTGKTFASISKQLEIPQKNVVRWCREGYLSRESSRNSQEDSWEGQLAGWIHLQKDKSTLSYNLIQDKAVQLSGNQRFKVSRAWIKSFLNRFDLYDQLVLKTTQKLTTSN